MTLFDAFIDELTKLGYIGPETVAQRLGSRMGADVGDQAGRRKKYLKKTSAEKAIPAGPGWELRKKVRKKIYPHEKTAGPYIHFEKRWPKDQDADHNDTEVKEDSGVPISWRERRKKADGKYIRKRVRG